MPLDENENQTERKQISGLQFHTIRPIFLDALYPLLDINQIMIIIPNFCLLDFEILKCKLL